MISKWENWDVDASNLPPSNTCRTKEQSWHTLVTPLLPSSLTHPSTLNGFSAIKEGADTTSLLPSEDEETQRALK